MNRAAACLRAGGLVGMPTETVYGLAADALNADAVRSIFASKGRPLNDPVICHIASPADAGALIGLGCENAQRAYAVLAEAFWPGPLTLVATASAAVPPVVMAGGSTVGVRCPAHPVARELIRRTGSPLAAPSANRFGHVSPTLPEHVVADLGATEGLLVLDPRLNADGCPGAGSYLAELAASGAGAVGAAGCGVSVGVESTVAAVGPGGHVRVLRHGGVSLAALTHTLQAAGLPLPTAAPPRQAAATHAAGAAPEAAPGQLLRHYAPDVPAFVIATAGPGPQSESGGHTGLKAALDSVVVLDIGHRLADAVPGLADAALAYRDMAPSGLAADAARGLFAGLRWAEDAADARAVAIADPREAAGSADGATLTHEAVFDRVLRATEGQAACLGPDGLSHTGAVAI